MRADLHLHSVWSDGAYTPREIAVRCKAAGVSMFSLTDHDNRGGSEEAKEAAVELGLRFVRGWEVSAYQGACQVHVLGYGCKKDEAYEKFLEERFEGAKVRVAQMIARANEFYGLNVTMDEVEEYHVRKHAPLHTMHVVKAFARHLPQKSNLYSEAFARGAPAFSEECRPTPSNAVEVIHKTGGIAVLAHPGRIIDLTAEEILRFRAAVDPDERNELLAQSAKNREELMDELVGYGLDGIECHYTTHTAIETEYFLAYAARHNLLVTGGSDFHAKGRRNVPGLPVFDMGEALAERLLCLEGSA